MVARSKVSAGSMSGQECWSNWEARYTQGGGEDVMGDSVDMEGRDLEWEVQSGKGGGLLEPHAVQWNDGGH